MRIHRFLRLLAGILLTSGATMAATAATLEQTRLGRLAQTLKPGEFALLDNPPQGLLSGYREDGSGAPAIDTWTDSAYWDSKRHRTFFLGLRKSNRFISYDAERDAWQEYGLDDPEAPPRFENYGHLYSRAALDWRGGHFYRLNGNTLHQYVIDERDWRRFPDIPGGGHVIEWHEAMDQLINLNAHQLYGFRDGHFQGLGRSAVHGYHATAKYNPLQQTMLLIGGNHTPTAVDILDADGQVQHRRDAPFEFTISQDNLTYDPGSGHFLVLHRDRKLWEYDPARDEWRVAREWSEGDFPLNRYHRHIPIPVPELGIIAWQTPSGLKLYRHKSVFPEDTPASGERSSSGVPNDAEPSARPHTSTSSGDAIPASLAGTRLAAVARNLEAGRFASLDAQLPSPPDSYRDFMRVKTGQGRALPIDAWTDSGHWDSETMQTFFLGANQRTKFVSYDAGADRWRELGWDGTPPPRDEANRYAYSRTALDSNRDHFYRLADDGLYRYRIAERVWERVAEAPAGGPSPITWHGALDRLVHANTDGVRILEDGRWRTIDHGARHGPKATARYSPITGEAIIVGGEGTRDTVTLINSQGEVRGGEALPFEHHLSVDNLTYDPQSGVFLVLRRQDRTLWAYDSSADRWQQHQRWFDGPWPFPRFGTLVPIPIDGLGVILLQSEQGSKLFRYAAGGVPDGGNDTPAPQRAGTTQPPQHGPTPKTRLAGKMDARPKPERPEYTPAEGINDPHPALARIAADMDAGEWRFVETRGFPELRVEFCPLDDKTSGSTYALGWTDAFAYHQPTHSFWAIGMRDSSEKRLFFLDRNLEWHTMRIPLDTCRTDRRPFNRLTIADVGEGPHLYWPSSNQRAGSSRADRGQLMRAPILPYLNGERDVEWSRYSPGFGISNFNNAGDFAVTWFPELGGWVFHGLHGKSRQAEPFSQEGHTEQGARLGKYWYGRTMFLQPENRRWTLFDRTYSGQYRSRLLYNPVKRVIALAPGGEFGSEPEGSEPRREWAIVHGAGGVAGYFPADVDRPIPWVEKVDRPSGDGFELPTYHTGWDSLTYNPVSGDYLWWSYRHKAMYTSPDLRTWQVYEDFDDMKAERFPEGITQFAGGSGLFGASEFIQVNAVPGTGLIVFFDPHHGLIAHKVRNAR